jgi:hypothetical protein
MMRERDAAKGQGRPEANELLVSVAEQLKVPLTVIARHAELGRLSGDPGLVDAAAIATQADAAMLLVDSYLLGLELWGMQTQLELEPVSVSSMLVDTAHDLQRFARQYNVEVELETAGRFGPVMSNARGLKAALLSLGFTLVEGQAALVKGPRRVVLAVNRTPHGIVTGMYGDYEAVSADAWRRALELCGHARQPFAALAGSGAGLFVADTILRSMDSRLRVGRYRHRRGLVATFQPSQQLALV